MITLQQQVKELEEWGDYSTNFSFRQGQGLPGRVYGTNKSEWQVIHAVVRLQHLFYTMSEWQMIHAVGRLQHLFWLVFLFVHACALYVPVS